MKNRSRDALSSLSQETSIDRRETLNMYNCRVPHVVSFSDIRKIIKNDLTQIILLGIKIRRNGGLLARTWVVRIARFLVFRRYDSGCVTRGVPALKYNFLWPASRYSDNSQYDNVPIRMRGSSGKGHHRDVSFNVPPPPKDYRSSKDDVEMLEQYFGVLRTTGTQTARTPYQPTDPGYVRHTASNWPQDVKSSTPRPSPEDPRI